MKAYFFSTLRADRLELRTSMRYLRHGSAELELNPPFKILDLPLDWELRLSSRGVAAICWEIRAVFRGQWDNGWSKSWKDV